MILNSGLRSVLNKIYFHFGLAPDIEHKRDWLNLIPEPYKAALIIGADFELAWAWRFSKRGIGNPEFALEKARQERKNIPKIIQLCDEYYIPITWATVGHLFLESCNKKDLPHHILPRPAFFENEYWQFDQGDWFQHDPCSNYKSSPEWYCPDLIRLILNAKVKHEIGCHTFSHIDCREKICSTELLQKDIEACKEAAKPLGIKLKTFVHPGYSIGNLDLLAREGFTSFRTDFRNVLGFPKKHKNGLWEFEQTAEFVFRKEWSIDYHIYRYKKIIERAIKSNTLCYYWFHPSFDPVFVEKIFPEVFKFINDNRNRIWVTTHSDYVKWITNRLQHD